MNWKIAATGIASGFLAGLLGVGGGIITIFGLVTFAGARQHVAHATSLAAIPPIAIIGSLMFASAGRVDFAAAVPLVVGAMVGVLIGTRVMIRIDENVLRRSLGVATLLVGVRLVLS